MAPSDWWVGDKSNDIFCCFVLLRADACSSCNFVLYVEIEILKGKLCITLSPFHRVKVVQLQPLKGVLHNKCPEKFNKILKNTPAFGDIINVSIAGVFF